MDLKDKILTWFINNLKELKSADATKLIGCTEGELIKEIAEISKSYDWIISRDGTGSSRRKFEVRKEELPAIYKFLNAGGFTGLEKNIQETNQQKEERWLLEMEQIKLQIDSLKQSVHDNKSTRRLSLIAIGISAVTVLIEIYRLIFLK